MAGLKQLLFTGLKNNHTLDGNIVQHKLIPDISDSQIDAGATSHIVNGVVKLKSFN